MTKQRPIVQMFDGLRNLMTGMGTSADKSQHRYWLHVPMDHQQIENAYRASWLIRKIVELPAEDMIREWRVWEAEREQVEAIEAIERAKKVQQELLAGMIYGRLGGGAVFIGTRTESDQPLGEREELLWLKAIPRHLITLGKFDWDPTTPNFGEPEDFRLSTQGGGQVFHPDRVIVFKGERHPSLTQMNSDEVYWGDSVVEVVNSAVQEAMATTKSFSALTDDARLDVFKVAGMADILLAPEGEERLRTRMDTVAIGKSNHRAIWLDSEDSWETRQVQWQGMPDIIKTFLMVVAGAADIPATRLYGKAPDGQNATGESDDRNYRSMIRTKQNRILRPALDRLDLTLLPTASVPTDLVWTFCPLTTPTEKEQADLDKQRADTARVWADSGLIPEVALAKGAQSLLVELGTYPALKEELDKLPDAALIPDPEDNDEDPSALTQTEPDDEDDDDLIEDAQPRTLYIKRPVLNAAALISWAKGQGFATTLPADDLHVTIIYSHAPVDWMKVGEPWNQDEDGTITIPPGSVRLVEQLGDSGATCLLFASSKLAWRHEEVVRAGASHGFADYQPHITLTYNKPADLDLMAIEPYRGEIVLGPEVFKELDLNWTPSEES